MPNSPIRQQKNDGDGCLKAEMSKGHSYFVLLDELKKPGCPICALAIKDSQQYLDHLFYESVLDVPIRMELLDSFGFCNWHTWKVPALPPICSPDTGFSIFASDLLRKFALLAAGMAETVGKKRTLKSLFNRISRKSASSIKENACPACRHVAQFESYRLKDLAGFIGEEDFLEAYKASSGICLPHLFLLEKRHSDHPNFPLLLELQLAKAQSLRDTLEEFIRKQDHRFRDEVTPDEANAWRVAMEFLVGKRGVFRSDMGRDLVERSPVAVVSTERPSVSPKALGRLVLKELVEETKTAREFTVYTRRKLPSALFEAMKELNSHEAHPTVAVVVEDLPDIEYLRGLHSAGFSLFYGLGLPSPSVIFLGPNRGFLLESNRLSLGHNLRPLKKPEDVYFKLLWRRFGNAVLISGSVTEKDQKGHLFCLATEGKREQWCRFKEPLGNKLPEVRTRVEVFASEKWNTHILEVLELRVLEAGWQTAP